MIQAPDEYQKDANVTVKPENQHNFLLLNIIKQKKEADALHFLEILARKLEMKTSPGF